jgi:hypothetical protein
MANTPQSKKRARQNERRNDINTARRSRIRTFVRKVEEAIASGDAASALAAFRGRTYGWRPFCISAVKTSIKDGCIQLSIGYRFDSAKTPSSAKFGCEGLLQLATVIRRFTSSGGQ